MTGPRLPRRIRRRLRAQRAIDSVAGWLVDHQHPLPAECLWRACRMW